MELKFEKVDTDQFVSSLCSLENDVKQIPIKFSKHIEEECLLDFVGKHVEIQNAIAMIKNSSTIGYTIFRCSDNDVEYKEMLKSLFDKVICLKNSNGEEKLCVCGCNKTAVKIYNYLKTNNQINKYINLFEKYKNNEENNGIYDIYKYECNKITLELNDEYLKWCKAALKYNSYITLSLCGFTLEDILKNNDLNALFSALSDIYVMFCKGVSVGAYIFSSN